MSTKDNSVVAVEWAGRWLPVLVWAAVIFCLSTDVASSANTSRFILPLLRWLFGNRLSADALGQIHLVIRKCGHLTEYALLAGLCWRALALGEPSKNAGRRVYFQALVLAALFAASDEFHQSFVPSRTASPRDVLIDTIGAAVALSAIRAWHARRIRRPNTGDQAA